MTELKDRVVVVTGAGGQLGGAVVEAAAAAGARVVLLDRSAARLAAMALAADADHFARAADLLDREALADALGEAHGRYGRLDGLVSTVGAFDAGHPAYAEEWSSFEAMLRANLQSAVTAAQVAAPLIGAGGSIVTIGARAALTGAGGMAAYAASKAALVNFTESLAADVAGRDIRANCVLPSIIDTPANRAAMPGADTSRWVPAAAIADVIVFLLSHAARAVSGAAIPVYGRS